MTVVGQQKKTIESSQGLVTDLGSFVKGISKKVSFQHTNNKPSRNKMDTSNPARAMSQKSGASSTGGIRVPVFVFPHEMTFFANEPSSHKQVVTIYNPYDIHIQYRVLSTAPHKYSMPDSKGTLPPRQRIDIIIRYTEVSDANIGVTDKFRFQIFDLSAPQVTLIGEKEVTGTLLATEESLSERSAETLRVQRKISSSQRSSALRSQEITDYHPQEASPSLFVILIGILCILALGLPNVAMETQPSNLPSYLHLTLNQKLIAAYILGLVTIVLFRTR